MSYQNSTQMNNDTIKQLDLIQKMMRFVGDVVLTSTKNWMHEHSLKIFKFYILVQTVFSLSAHHQTCAAH